MRIRLYPQLTKLWYLKQKNNYILLKLIHTYLGVQFSILYFPLIISKILKLSSGSIKVLLCNYLNKIILKLEEQIQRVKLTIIKRERRWISSRKRMMGQLLE